MANPNNEEKSVTAGLKFNSVMRDAPARQVIKPKRDPARQMQIAIGVMIALFAFGVLAFMSFQRSGLNPFQTAPDEHEYAPSQDRKIQSE